MTIERARELLGMEIDNLTDVEVSDMIQRDSSFMEVLLDILTNTQKEPKWN